MFILNVLSYIIAELIGSSHISSLSLAEKELLQGAGKISFCHFLVFKHLFWHHKYYHQSTISIQEYFQATNLFVNINLVKNR
jgi:hypothetical protein